MSNEYTVTINDNYRAVLGTVTNVTLQEHIKGGKVISYGKHKGKVTKDKWNDIGYYPNMQQALREVIRREAQDNPDADCSSLEAYIEKLDTLDKKYGALY